jgi:hypothetical protein
LEHAVNRRLISSDLSPQVHTAELLPPGNPMRDEDSSQAHVAAFGSDAQTF